MKAVWYERTMPRRMIPDSRQLGMNTICRAQLEWQRSQRRFGSFARKTKL
jgi:hypothetical protein